MNDNYLVFFIAIVSEVEYTPEQAFRAYDHGHITKQRGLKKGTPGRNKIDIDIERALRLKKQMTWQEVADELGVHTRTLQRQAISYRNDLEDKGRTGKIIPGKPGRKALALDVSKITELRKQALSWNKIAAIMGVSARTLRKRAEGLA